MIHPRSLVGVQNRFLMSVFSGVCLHFCDLQNWGPGINPQDNFFTFFSISISIMSPCKCTGMLEQQQWIRLSFYLQDSHLAIWLKSAHSSVVSQTERNKQRMKIGDVKGGGWKWQWMVREGWVTMCTRVTPTCSIWLFYLGCQSLG